MNGSSVTDCTEVLSICSVLGTVLSAACELYHLILTIVPGGRNKIFIVQKKQAQKVKATEFNAGCLASIFCSA